MRYDKYDPIAGGFRAALAADLAKITATANGIGVGLNATGLVVPGNGNTGVLGVVCVTRDMKAGDTVDVMTDGECVEAVAPIVAGTVITADSTTGVLGVAVPSATKVAIGYTVEATRLVVRRSGAVPSTVVVGDQTAIAVLTGAFGTTGNAIADVTAAFSQTILNNNFRVLEDKVNAILAALGPAGSGLTL